MDLAPPVVMLVFAGWFAVLGLNFLTQPAVAVSWAVCCLLVGAAVWTGVR